MQTRLSANQSARIILVVLHLQISFPIWRLASGSGDLNPRIPVAVQKDREFWEIEAGVALHFFSDYKNGYLEAHTKNQIWLIFSYANYRFN